MTFARINGGGWAANASLTSAQANALDIDHANALDKTVAGDTIAGVVILGAAAKLTTSGGGTFELKNNDYVKLGAGHAGLSQVRTRLIAGGAVYAAAWTIGLISLVRPALKGNATTDVAIIQIEDILQNGETISQIDLLFQITNNHAGGLPAVQPQFSFVRYKKDGTNLSLGTIVMAAGTTGVYYNGGAAQTLSLTGLTEVIDKTQYTYGILLQDESGANSVAGNLFQQITTTATIADVRPF